MAKHYIAFSIHGTNTFIVATKDISNKLPRGYTVAISRRSDYEAIKDGVKVHWDGLLTSRGVPTKSPALVLQRFTQLKAEGWKIIGRDTFVKYHYRDKKKH